VEEAEKKEKEKVLHTYGKGNLSTTIYDTKIKVQF
jgi:hypothetical protein